MKRTPGVDDSVRNLALRDISQHIKESQLLVQDDYHDVWTVTPARMKNKKTARLNKELNINKINKQWLYKH